MAGLAEGGGGGKAIEAGRAVVRASLDDGPVLNSLARMQGKFKDFGKNIKDITPEGGLLGKFVGMGARGGAIGAGLGVGALAVRSISEDISEWVTGAKAYRNEIEAALKRTADLAARAAEVTAASREWAGAVSNPARKISTNLAGVVEQKALLAQAQAERAKLVEQLEARFSGATKDNIFRFLGGDLRDSIKDTRTGIKGIDEDIAKIMKEMERLHKESLKIADPSKDPVFMGGVDQLKRAMETAVDTDGLTGFSKAVSDLAIKFPAAAKLIKDEGLALKAATADLEVYVRAQERMVEEMNMTADELAIHRAEQAGLDPVSAQAAEDELKRIAGRKTQGNFLFGPALQMLDFALNAPKLPSMRDMAQGAFASSLSSQSFAGDQKTQKTQQEIAKNTLDTANNLVKLATGLQFGP